MGMQLLSSQQAAVRLGVTVGYLANLRNWRMGPEFIRERGRIYYTPKSLKDFQSQPAKPPRRHKFWPHIKIAAMYHEMKQRCTNPNRPNWKYYGARGISVCKLWAANPKSFARWAVENGWKEGLELDRINNGKGYSPSNCRLVTHAENMRNQRRASA